MEDAEDSLEWQQAEIVDVTDDPVQLHEARRNIAAAYSFLLSPHLAPSFTIDDIYRELCTDGYETDGRSRTLAAYNYCPEIGERVLSGTLRIVFGRMSPAIPATYAAKTERMPAHVRIPPIDAMRVIEPIGEWPHRLAGFNDSQIAEFGRLQVSILFRTPRMTQTGAAIAISRQLSQKGYDVARRGGAKILYAVMSPFMLSLSKRAGLRNDEIPSRLRTQDQYASKLYEYFSEYWVRFPPRLYQSCDL